MKQIDKYPHKSRSAAKSESRQTLKAGGNFTDRLKAYRDQHAQSFFSSLGRLFASPFTTAMTVGLLAIAIALASGFYLVIVNVRQLTAGLENSNQISLFLRDEISSARAKQFADKIRANPDVKRVEVISKQQGLEEFKKFGGFGEAIDLLEKNPLPTVIEVLPNNNLTDKEKLTALLEQLKKQPEVDLAQLDLVWMERLHSIVSAAELAAILLAVLLGATVFFIAGNTIRLEIHNRRQEIIIAKLVGATNSFIQRPFLYTAFWLGFFSSVFAWFIVTLSLLILRPSVEHLSGLYEGSFTLRFFSYSDTAVLLAVSTSLSVLGAWLVLQIQIKQLNPD